MECIKWFSIKYKEKHAKYQNATTSYKIPEVGKQLSVVSLNRLRDKANGMFLNTHTYIASFRIKA
jgi:hypothetical protein